MVSVLGIGFKNLERFAAVGPCGFRSISENANTNLLRNLPVLRMVGGENGKNLAPVKNDHTFKSY